MPRGTSPQQRAILAVMADLRIDRETGWPIWSVEHLCRQLEPKWSGKTEAERNVRRASVSRAMSRLYARGLVEKSVYTQDDAGEDQYYRMVRSTTDDHRSRQVRSHTGQIAYTVGWSITDAGLETVNRR